MPPKLKKMENASTYKILIAAIEKKKLTPVKIKPTIETANTPNNAP